MQPFVNINHQAMAKIFASYLNSIGIATRVTDAQDDNGQRDGYTLWCEEQHMAQARIEFEQFRQNPGASKYQSSAWNSGASVSLPSSGSWLTLKNSFIANAGPLTLIIFAICWLVYLATFVVFGDSLYQLVLFNQFGDIEQTISQPWRFITPALFHYGLLHIAFNTMWWWQLGGQIEKQLGSSWLMAIFMISAIVSNVSQFYVSGPNFGGLSGVVYAVFGFVWWFGYLNPGRGIGISQSLIGFMLFWLVLGFTDFMPINVANTAHLMGLISGSLLAFVYNYQDSKAR
ncbi:rhomboid family intramembrane serine protease GlpG [Thalassotalea sp. HSM 43]|uniref:rhomboid family intramembrane serine protease GlpG n=1 Tax=Thalassotalea sp. HSM 43 TaxID=2552945 RepID=UPI00107FD67E|nr:rhomboid family intramembrane serine protease GlpG [Thalassotalea sp. HSM 43]QBY04035.1 rhomboid family intramembrane serine protease GlpG [Thalassotalea sp. HSM 43]